MTNTTHNERPLFTLGQVFMTPGAEAALEAADQSSFEFLARHVAGDWGEGLPPEDIQAKLREAVSKVAASDAYKSWIESAGYVWANKGPEDTMKAVDGAKSVYAGIAPLIKQE